MRSNLQTELLSVESEIQNEMNALAQMEDVATVLDAPDVFIAASALI